MPPISSEINLLDAVAASDLDADSDEEGSSWVLPQVGEPNGSTIAPELPMAGLAEWVAYVRGSAMRLTDCDTDFSQHAMPYLPPAAPAPPPFTVRGVRLLIHRALLIIFHTYIPIFSRALRLASWKDTKTSLTYCLVSRLRFLPAKSHI